MAKFRMIHTAFWDDPKVVEELTPEDKYFFLYLLTNSNTTQVGIYQITKKQMAFDLGYSMESVNSLLERFIHHHEMVRYNPESRELAIRNWGKYNLNRGGKPMLDCVTAELKEVKDESLISYVGENVVRDDIRQIYDTYTNRKEHFDDEEIIQDEEDLPEIYNKTSEVEKGSDISTSHDTCTTRGQYKEKEEEKEEYKDRVRDLFDHFVSKKIIQHKKMTDAMKNAIKARLKDYSHNELVKAIDNYAQVYFSNNHWFTHKYPLADFMRDKDVRKFLDEADPINNFMNRPQKKSVFGNGVRKEDFDLS